MSMEKMEYWIRQGQGKVIALLHGIGANDPQDYWQAFLDVLVNDEQLQDYGLFVCKYPTHIGPAKWKNIANNIAKRTLRETAPRIKHLGAVWNTTYHTQFRNYQDVILVCHSMGGLVVKSWIIDALEGGQSTTLGTLRHITFYATPHNGAQITTLANWNKQLKDMQLDSPFIQDIGNRWHERVVAWKEKVPGPETSLYNKYIPHLVIAGLVDHVVPSNNAAIRGMPLTTIQGDHSEVIQPVNADDTRYKVWRNAIEGTLQARSQRSQPFSKPALQNGNEHQQASLSLTQQITSTSPVHSPVQQQNPAPSYHSCVLSYATDDQAFAEKLHADLTQQGVSCWFAPHDLKMGDKLRDKIYEAIQRQDKLLIVLSEHAIGSAWVEEEVDAALDREHLQKGTFLLFPIRLDDQVLQTSKAWAIAVRQRYIGDFRQWMDDAMYQRALQRLLRDLKA